MDIYKITLNEIGKPIRGLRQYKIQGVIEKLWRGNMEEKMCARALSRLNQYINMTLQSQDDLKEFTGEHEYEATRDDDKDCNG